MKSRFFSAGPVYARVKEKKDILSLNSPFKKCVSIYPESRKCNRCTNIRKKRLLQNGTHYAFISVYKVEFNQVVPWFKVFSTKTPVDTQRIFSLAHVIRTPETQEFFK
jgi:hypothetical protein